jgi:hypothetical protein
MSAKIIPVLSMTRRAAWRPSSRAVTVIGEDTIPSVRFMFVALAHRCRRPITAVGRSVAQTM